jgi:hypothetical protein
MTLAIVGDLHGHLHLLYAILGRWRRETGSAISLILQVGDLGAFGAGSRLDSATARFSERDPEELGFAAFGGASPPRTLLDPRPPLVFVPGNHEDFELLDACDRRVPASEAVYPVSADGRILALRSGRIWTYGGGPERIRVGGLSGVANRPPRKGRHPRLHLSDDDALALGSAGRGGFDILLSHDRPDGIWPTFRDGAQGSAAIRLVIEAVQPPFAFFGHYNRAGEWAVGSTRVIGLSDCGYDHKNGWRVDIGGIGILRWSADGSASFERVVPEWLVRSTRFDWRHWGRVD